MATKNKVNIISDIVAEIRTGSSDTTAAGLRTVLYEILDSYVNVKDGGLLYETAVGYNSLLTLTDAKSFVYKQWVEDYISTTVGLGAVLTVDNKTNEQSIISNDGNSKAGIINGEVFFEYSPASMGAYFNGIRSNVYQTWVNFQDTLGSAFAHLKMNAPSAELRHSDIVYLTSPTLEANSTLSISLMVSGSSYGEVSINNSLNNFYHDIQNIFNAPVNKFTNGGIYFVSGIGIDTTATAGSDVLNIGATNANVINIGNSGAIVNFLGTAIYEYAINAYVEDKLVTYNHNGAAGSAINAGFEIEEDGSIAGYFMTNGSRDGYMLKSPAIAHDLILSLANLTAQRTYSFPDASGTFALISDLSPFVPYTGAAADVDLGNYSLNGKSLHIKGTAGNGHLGLKHQSSGITAATSESSFGADVSGNPVWKNDGNALQYVTLNDGTQTLTNKRITSRITTISSSATPTINTDNCDTVDITALAVAITSMTTNLTGTPTHEQKLIIKILDNGVARAITWGASFVNKGGTLPTTTTAGKLVRVGLIYSTTTAKWECVAVALEA